MYQYELTDPVYALDDGYQPVHKTLTIMAA